MWSSLVTGKGLALLELVFKAHLKHVATVIAKSLCKYFNQLALSRYNCWELPSVHVEICGREGNTEECHRNFLQK